LLLPILRGFAAAAIAELAVLPLSAQTHPDFGGVWLVDMARKDAREVYAELRVIEQTPEPMQLTMVDYGAMWTGGAFRAVVRFTPWTYRFGSWGPRRGRPGSTEPITRARWSGDDLVLVKTPGQPAGHTWVWKISDDRAEVVQHETAQSWDSDFSVRPPEGGRTYLRRAQGPVRMDSIGRLDAALGRIVTEFIPMTISIAPDRREMRATCLEHDCMIVELRSGVEVGSRPLPRGSTASIPIPAEGIIKPVP
jgi:hypothetical protein